VFSIPLYLYYSANMKYQSTVLLLLFLFLSCNNSESNENISEFQESEVSKKNIELKLHDRITLSVPDSVVIAAPNYTFEMDRNGERMAFFDVMTYRFLIFDKDGKFLHSLGRDGRGPEEFMMVYSYAFDEKGNFIVYDDGLKMLKIFDDTYQIQNSISIKNDEYYFASHKLFAEDGFILTGILETKFAGPSRKDEVWKSRIVSQLTYDGAGGEVFGIYDPYLKQIVPSTYRPVLFMGDEMLYTSHSNSYRIQVFNLDSKKREHYFGYRSENFGHLEEEIDPREPLETRFRKGFEESSTRMIHADDDYVYHYFINGTEQWLEAKDLSALKNHLVVYDKLNRQFIGEIVLPHRLSYARDNRFYLLENEDPDQFTIGIYEVVINS